MKEIKTQLADLYVSQKSLDYDEMVGKIFECRPKNMPEDFNYDLDVPFIIGDSFEEVFNEYDLKIDTHRFCFRKNGTWCGEHPTHWRQMTQNEALAWAAFYINSVKNKRK